MVMSNLMGYLWSGLAALVIACTGGASIWALSAAEARANSETERTTWRATAYITAEVANGVEEVLYSRNGGKTWEDTLGGDLNSRLFMKVILADGFENVSDDEIIAKTRGAGIIVPLGDKDKENVGLERLFRINLLDVNQVVTIGDLPVYYKTNSSIYPVGVTVAASKNYVAKNESVDYIITLSDGYELDDIAVTGAEKGAQTQISGNKYRLFVEKIVANVEIEISVTAIEIPPAPVYYSVGVSHNEFGIKYVAVPQTVAEGDEIKFVIATHSSFNYTIQELFNAIYITGTVGMYGIENIEMQMTTGRAQMFTVTIPNVQSDIVLNIKFIDIVDDFEI